MVSRGKLAETVAVLATASMIATGLAVGGQIGSTVMAGIGINLASAIISSGAVRLRQRWMSSPDGIRNRDVQLVLARAFSRALTYLEAEYWKLGEANALPENEKASIRLLFKQLKREACGSFLSSLSTAVSQLSTPTDLSTEPKTARHTVWELVDTAGVLSSYSEHLGSFLRSRLLDEVCFRFAEELKTDSTECNRAWRAFQRLLLEGISADVKAVHASQELIQQDLQTLATIETGVAALKDTLDRRLPDEPFLRVLENATADMRAALRDIALTAERTDQGVESIAADVSDIKTLLDSKTEWETPRIPDDVRAAINEGWDLRNRGEYPQARDQFRKALALATGYGDRLAVARSEYCLAVVAFEFDRDIDRARIALVESLREFKASRSGRDVSAVFHQLGVMEIRSGNLDEARAYFTQALELDRAQGEKLSSAYAIHQLGWIEDHRGRAHEALELYDEALTLFLGPIQECNEDTQKEASQGVGGCYHHKALLLEHQGRIGEAESNYLRALEWYRKSGFKPDIAQVLYLLSGLKYRQAEYDTGTEFLDEAQRIYNEMADHSWCARCLDMRGRLHFTLGQRDKAAALFQSALEAVRSCGDWREEEAYLNKLGQVHLEANELAQATSYFEQAMALCKREEHLDGYVSAVEGLAQIADIQEDSDERDRLLLDGVHTLEDLLDSVQADPKRAFTLGRIGSLYDRMHDYEQALVHYLRAKDAFAALSDTAGVARALGSIARVKGLLGRRNEEFDTYRQLKELLEGSPYHDLVAVTAANLGGIYAQIGNLDEAKLLLQEAYALCQKYKLPHLPHVTSSLRQLTEQSNARRAPETNLEELIRELSELVDWFPEAKDSLFRLWMSGRTDALLGNLRNTVGVNLMICEEDVPAFLAVSESFHPYSSMCMQVVSCAYPGTGMDMIPFPKDKTMFFDHAVPVVEESVEGLRTVKFLHGSLRSRYTLVSGVPRSETTGNEGCLIMGWSPGLPRQAHELILSRPAAELLDRKVFFLPYQRHLAEDKAVSDLQFGKEIGLFPVYAGSLPDSDNVHVCASTTVRLPVLSRDRAKGVEKHIRRVRQRLIHLLSITRQSAQPTLADLTCEAGELSDSAQSADSLDLQVYILEFPRVLEKELHAALVLQHH